MKDDDNLKEKGSEPATEPEGESKQLGRSEFLKTVGVGAAAAGLGILTGDQSLSSAATEPGTSRSSIQTLMRGLLENPSRAKDFLDSPQTVAEELGVRLTEADANKIKEALTRLAREVGGAGLTGHNDTHTDSGHTDGTTTPRTRKPGAVAPKLPAEGVEQKPPKGGGRRR